MKIFRNWKIFPQIFNAIEFILRMVMQCYGSSNDPIDFCYLLSHQRPMESSWKKELNKEFGSPIDFFIIETIPWPHHIFISHFNWGVGLGKRNRWEMITDYPCHWFIFWLWLKIPWMIGFCASSHRNWKNVFTWWLDHIKKILFRKGWWRQKKKSVKF